MTKVTLETETGTYTIETEGDGYTVYDMYETFFNPIMLAATYHPDSVNDYFVEKSIEFQVLDDDDDYEDEEDDCHECSCGR